MKCDEQRPRCSHCERLNLECKWRPHHTVLPKQRQDVNGEGSTSGEQLIISPSTNRSPTTAGVRTLQAMDDVFDYASFMWDPTSSLWQQESPDITTTIALNTHVVVSILQCNLQASIHPWLFKCPFPKRKPGCSPDVLGTYSIHK